ncbi:hypothetical protein D3C76_1217210 [compost metagenome]
MRSQIAPSVLNGSVPVRHRIHDRAINQHNICVDAGSVLRFKRPVDEPHRGVVCVLGEQRNALLNGKCPEGGDGFDADPLHLKYLPQVGTEGGFSG